MSPRRVLKTKFPCKTCGEPAEVERLRYAEHAMCDRCSARNEAIRRWRWREDSIRRRADEANGKDDDRDRLTSWLDVVADQLKAVADRVRSLPRLTPAERRHVAIGAASRLKAARGNLRRLAVLMSRVEKESDTLEIFSGSGEASEVPPPVLRLVKS